MDDDARRRGGERDGAPPGLDPGRCRRGTGDQRRRSSPGGPPRSGNVVGMGGRLAAYEHDGLRFDVRDQRARGRAGRRRAARLPADLGLVGARRRRASPPPAAGSSRRTSGATRPAPARGAVSAYALPAPGRRRAGPGRRRRGRSGSTCSATTGAVPWPGRVAAAHPDRVRTLTVASTPHPRGDGRGAAARAGAAQLVHGRVPAAGAARSGCSARRGPAAGCSRRWPRPHPDAVQAFLSDRDAARGALAWYRAAFRSGLRRGGEPRGGGAGADDVRVERRGPGAGAVGRRAHGGVGGRRLPLRGAARACPTGSPTSGPTSSRAGPGAARDDVPGRALRSLVRWPGKAPGAGVLLP